MKTSTTLLIALLLSVFVKAQNPGYQKAMGEALTEMGTAQTAEDLQEAANSFSRIATMADGDYLPDYYAALSQINRSFRMQSAAERDKALEAARAHVEKAAELNPGSSEVEVLNGYVLMAKLTIDPANRGQKLTPQVMQSFGKAMGMDPENPRAKVMMARMELGTAQFFGSGTEKPCAMAQRSIPLFEKESPEGFEPSWGREIADGIIAECK
jgi:tetratricopeptide (TPR) repeat protein